MTRRNILKWWGSILLAGVLISGLALASSGGTFRLTRSTFEGSGGVSSGGAFVLRGTAGQPEWQLSSGGDFAVYGGYWHPRPSVDIYLPLVIRE